MSDMLVRVFEIPIPTGNWHFGKAEPQTFMEVDWFRVPYSMCDTAEGKRYFIKFIKEKQYFSPDKSYLVLLKDYTFTINYDPDQRHVSSYP